jgi:hypothetical protein
MEVQKLKAPLLVDYTFSSQVFQRKPSSGIVHLEDVNEPLAEALLTYPLHMRLRRRRPKLLRRSVHGAHRPLHTRRGPISP